ncbi:outer membrane lipoprotein carrier protein LolA [bacterium]|nr:outer membrane lipoprotein carrier protein LolA [bacterium]
MPKFLSSTGAPLSQAEAKAELLRLQQTYKGLNTFQASFVQRSYLKSLDLEETSEGRLALAFPGRLLWEYDKPEKQYFLLKGGEFQLYQPREKQLIIQSTEKFFLSDIPVAFLLGLGDLANDFRVQNGCRREKSVTLSLEPNRTSVRGAEDPLRELTLTFHQGEYLPVVAAVLDREGNKTSFALYGRRTDLPLSEKEFRLPVPEGTDVQDLR